MGKGYRFNYFEGDFEWKIINIDHTMKLGIIL